MDISANRNWYRSMNCFTKFIFGPFLGEEATSIFYSMDQMRKRDFVFFLLQYGQIIDAHWEDRKTTVISQFFHQCSRGPFPISYFDFDRHIEQAEDENKSFVRSVFMNSTEENHFVHGYFFHCFLKISIYYYYYYYLNRLLFDSKIFFTKKQTIKL